MIREPTTAGRATEQAHPSAIDVLCVGEALVVGDVPTRAAGGTYMALGVGGAELNVALALDHAGLSAALATRIGDDPLGDLIEDAVSASGVGAIIERDVNAPTGFYLREHRVAGRRVHYYRRGSAGSVLPQRDVVRDRLSRSSILHITGITAALSPENPSALLQLIDDARAVKCAVSFDVNFREQLWPSTVAATVLRDIALRADLVFVGADESRALWGSKDSEETANVLTVTELVIKDSERRAIDVVRSGDSTSFAVPEVDVVDSVGAGDAFAAGYLHAVARGDAALQTRCANGHAFAHEALLTTDDALDAPAVARALDRSAVLNLREVR